ncbi:MAG: 30S ribosomal protein S9 [Nitrospirae bacterium RBG_19FT_COMBO_42_15]|nr:MAG: 30S ribosomal protein S9 [Nitrospirae bacterium RBG_19FT_COMBO_42_15]
MAEAIYATGKRKNAVARVLVSPGSGKIIVNNKELGDYFGRETLQMMVRQPLELTENLGKLNISANVLGGGLSGQAGAIRHGITKALIAIDSSLRDKLKKEGLITRDSREKERKKYGQKGARKKFQFSKR